jgi:hypothetical protein
MLSLPMFATLTSAQIDHICTIFTHAVEMNK